MAKYGQPDLVIEVGPVGGSLDDISSDVLTLNGADVEAITEQSDGFGAEWVTHLFVGVKRLEPLVVGGFYDDEAGSGAMVLNAPGSTLSVKLTWGGAKTTEFDAIVSQYNRTPNRGEMTKFEATLSPTGPVVEN